VGDKSPKNKQREKNQKDTAKTTTKNDQAKRQAGFASTPTAEKGKKK